MLTFIFGCVARALADAAATGSGVDVVSCDMCTGGTPAVVVVVICLTSHILPLASGSTVIPRLRTVMTHRRGSHLVHVCVPATTCKRDACKLAACPRWCLSRVGMCSSTAHCVVRGCLMKHPGTLPLFLHLHTYYPRHPKPPALAFSCPPMSSSSSSLWRDCWVPHPCVVDWVLPCSCS